VEKAASGCVLVADELCIADGMEGAHRRPFTALLATLLTVELLPEETTAQRS
jgi:hypothetical protein